MKPKQPRARRTAQRQKRSARKQSSPAISETSVRTLTDITKRKHAEEQLARHSAILGAVTFAAEKFLRGGTWQAHIQEVIERLGRSAGVSRVYIFQNHRDESGELFWRQSYEWCDHGTLPQIDNAVLQRFYPAREGFARWVSVMQAGKSIKDNVANLPASEQRELVAEDIQSIACVPIMVKQSWWGLIGFDDCQSEREWSTAEIDALTAAANTLGAAIERQQVDEELHQRASELEAVRQASLSLTATLEPSAVLDAILKSVFELTPTAKDAHVFLYQDGHLSFGASLWADGRRGQQWAEPRPNGLTYTVAHTGRTIPVADLQTHPLFANAPRDWTGAIIGLPLKMSQQVVGVMTIAYQLPRIFSKNELRVLELLAAQAAIAIENARLYDQVQQLAITDPLTGLYNRRGLFDLGERELSRARRLGHPLTATLFDIDHFKLVNDTYGHAVGDLILKAVAECCRQHLRVVDLLARYGGEEFIALMPDTDLATAQLVAERLRQAVEAMTTRIDSLVIPVTISLGVAELTLNTPDLIELFDRADQAQYRAKQTGRNRVESN